MNDPIDLNDMVIFARVAELQGISAAARALRMPKSKVSRRMAGLEEQLGVRLLERSTRAVHLTEIGDVFYRHCQRIVEEADNARDSVARMLESPRGHLRIGASVAIGQHLLAPRLKEFMSMYPEIEVEVQLENRRVDLIREGYDLVVRVGDLEDSALISRPLGTFQLFLVASGDYLDLSGAPAVPQDLNEHHCLVMGDAQDFNQWTLVNAHGQQESVQVRDTTVLNDLTMIRRVALDGGGIALLPSYLVESDLTTLSSLKRVLPEWTTPSFQLYALYPSRGGATLKVRACLDFLVQKFEGA
ncbi:MAG: LysR family transcriptional regulator [Pseudomonadota bacterium]